MVMYKSNNKKTRISVVNNQCEIIHNSVTNTYDVFDIQKEKVVKNLFTTYTDAVMSACKYMDLIRDVNVLGNNKPNREKALNWWNNLNSKEKNDIFNYVIDNDNSIVLGLINNQKRNFNLLTGREIENIWKYMLESIPTH